MWMSPPSLFRVETERQAQRLRKTFHLFCLPVLLTLGIFHGTPGVAGDFSAQEERNARAVVQTMESEWPLRAVNDPASRYIQSLARRLGQVGNGMTGGRVEQLSSRIIRDRAPYAFSTTGNLFLSEGMITFVRNESELAAVLSHEIGHQLAGHFSAPPGDYLAPDGDRSPQRQRVGSLIQVFVLDKEEEADRQAITVLHRAGFDPHALLSVLKRLPVKGVYHYSNNERRTRDLQQELEGFASQSRLDSGDFLTIQALVQNDHGE
jgi:hypothetical protein